MSEENESTKTNAPDFPAWVHSAQPFLKRIAEVETENAQLRETVERLERQIEEKGEKIMSKEERCNFLCGQHLEPCVKPKSHQKDKSECVCRRTDCYGDVSSDTIVIDAEA